MTKYERHIRSLCKKHGIEILYVDRLYRCNVWLKKIFIRKGIRSIKSYVMALHEVSHIINEYPQRRQNFKKDVWQYWKDKKGKGHTSRHTLIKEIEAWRLAYKLAKWWSPTASKIASSAVCTYAAAYNDFHKKPVMDDGKLLDLMMGFFMGV